MSVQALQDALQDLDWVGLAKTVFAPLVAVPQWAMTLHDGLPKEFGLLPLVLIGAVGFMFMSLFKGWVRWIFFYLFVGSVVTIFLLVKNFI